MVENSIEIISVDENSIELISRFLQNANDSLKSFRYFETRSLDVINNHILTIVLSVDNVIIGYGHLDRENENIWLGIALADNYRGLGYGKKIMKFLLDHASSKNISDIKLSVDKENINAIKLYESFGFFKIKDLNEKSLLMRRHVNIKNDIYISTLAFMGLSLEEISLIATENDFAIEFSSGLPFYNNMIEYYENSNLKRIPHNYFPAPEVPFVLNLASKDNGIRQTSINHCIQGLQLSKSSDSPFFSAHAGFCIDPSPNELGKKINYSNEINRQLHKEIFIDSLQKIKIELEKNDQFFLIENNVIASFNMSDNQINPLLCCDSKEIIEILESINSNRIQLLLDTAHLKVSCNTLGLNLQEELMALIPYIKCIHHSDNDGMKDTNEQIDENYWFLPYLNHFENIPHVIEVKSIDTNQIKRHITLLQNYGC